MTPFGREPGDRHPISAPSRPHASEGAFGRAGSPITDEPVRVETVLAWLREQRELYARLAALADRQSALVGADDARPLLKVLAERQTLTGELSRIGHKLLPVRQDWSSIRQRLTPAQAAEAADLLESASSVLRKVMAQDAEDARRLAVRKRTTAQDAATSATSRALLAGYRPAGTAPAAASWQG